MAKSDRLFRLLQAMRVMPAPITASRLAEETGVSVRSLYRDIDSLRAAGARIEGERGYGYRLVEDYALPPQTFDRAEIEAIALGLAEVRSMGDPVLAEAAASVLAKVKATLPDDREQYLFHAISQVYRPKGRFAASEALGAIREACWTEQAVAISYADRTGAVSARTIWPLAVIYTDRTLTVPVLVLPAQRLPHVPGRPDQRVGDNRDQLSAASSGAAQDLSQRVGRRQRHRPACSAG